MQATGIVRRIDDLGRIVIPRELRRKLDIKEGDPLEIYVDDGGVLLKPYVTDDPDQMITKSGNKMITALDQMFEGNESDDDYQLTRMLLERVVKEFGKK